MYDVDSSIKMLMSFVATDAPRILVSDCGRRDILEKLSAHGRVDCTASDCENRERCVKLNLAMPFLPLKRYDVWVADLSRLRINAGYIFHLASTTLKMLGILAIIGDIEEDIALAYGFQILHHGEWQYFLKAYEKGASVIDLGDTK